MTLHSAQHVVTTLHNHFCTSMTKKPLTLIFSIYIAILHNLSDTNDIIWRPHKVNLPPQENIWRPHKINWPPQQIIWQLKYNYLVAS